ncbi:MAG: L-lysine 6-transaminase [Rhodothermales bacterium]|nr:L-lysine 6-transaminase [Rhodothermales bacterium]MDG2016337.1 L-lysine 6-transaminase [Rhodothermales bacterium]
MEKSQTKAILPDDVEDIFLKHTNAEGMMPIVLGMQSSSGIDLVDEQSDRSYMDFFGFYASNAIGMNHPKLVGNEEFKERLMDAALNKVTNSDIRTRHMARFLDTFGRVAIPDYLPYAFFVSGGALAVENALKTAFDWKVRKNYQKGYRREVGHKVLHFDQAFHGRTGYTLTLTNTADPRKTMHFPQFDWPRVSNPKVVFPIEEHIDDIVRREQVSLNQARHYFDSMKDEIACIIIEPIQGEGGDNHFRKEFLQALKDLCMEYDALLIFDEVQTGVGMTGAMWAHQAIGVEPDIISFGKKTQVCGILAGRRLDEVEDHVFKMGSRINSTWGGNLVDMVRFDRILEIIEEDNLIEHARVVGDHLNALLDALSDETESVSNVRGMGLMCAIDLPSTEFRDRLLQRCFDEGMIILGCGAKSIRFRSPLTITKEEIDKGMHLLRAAILKIEEEYRPYQKKQGLTDALMDG